MKKSRKMYPVVPRSDVEAKCPTPVRVCTTPDARRKPFPADTPSHPEGLTHQRNLRKKAKDHSWVERSFIASMRDAGGRGPERELPSVPKKSYGDKITSYEAGRAKI